MENREINCSLCGKSAIAKEDSRGVVLPEGWVMRKPDKGVPRYNYECDCRSIPRKAKK